jgi:hypothetical protein
MPRRPPKNKAGVKLTKEDALKKKQELEDLIFNDEMLDGLGAPDIPPMKPMRMMNFDSLKTEVETEAKSILTSLIKFYMDSDIIEEGDYVHYRAKIDALSISTMAFQIRTAQHAVTKMLDEIDAGGQYQARNFEVLAQMQNQLMQMPLKLQSYLADMEKTYKSLNTEAKASDNVKQSVMMDDDGNPVTIPGINGEGGTVKVRGNKTLMEGLQNVIKTEVIVKKAQVVEDVEKNLIDPKMKDLITPENELKQQMEDETKIELDEDLF